MKQRLRESVVSILARSTRGRKQRSNSLFQTQAMTQKGMEKRPFDHFAFLKSPRVKISLFEIMTGANEPQILT